MDAPFGSWGTQTFIAGLSAEAMIALWVIKGAMDGAAFAAYVEKVLAPELSPGTVCPSSDDLEQGVLIGSGGSGSLWFQSMPLSVGAASGVSGLSLP